MMIEITAEYLAAQGLSPSFPRRFWAKVRKTDSCWLWTAGLANFGYGKIALGGKPYNSKIRAHRASWILHCGPIPEGMQVLHNCPGKDNPACVNPDHLKLGTQSENVYDEYKKGRNPANSKLLPEDVITIREMYSTGMANQNQLASQFGISQSNVSMIVHGIKRSKYAGTITTSQ